MGAANKGPCQLMHLKVHTQVRITFKSFSANWALKRLGVLIRSVHTPHVPLFQYAVLVNRPTYFAAHSLRLVIISGTAVLEMVRVVGNQH